MPAAVVNSMPFGVLRAPHRHLSPAGWTMTSTSRSAGPLMVGLTANGILIVEFAVEKLKEGKTVTQAGRRWRRASWPAPSS